jgi:hypothetical protein
VEPRSGTFGVRIRWLERAVGSNRILLYLAGVTLVLSTGAGVLMRWIDESAFPTIGTGIWWAVVTLSLARIERRLDEIESRLS